MSEANDPLAEKKLQLEIESLTQQMSQLASAKRKLEFEGGPLSKVRTEPKLRLRA
jgi:hypothetical protein